MDIYKLMVILKGPSGSGKSTLAKNLENFFTCWGNTACKYFDHMFPNEPNSKTWEVRFFHETYGVAMTRFFEGRVTAVTWQSICHGIHLNNMIEAMDFLKGATPQNPRMVILDRSLEDVAIFTWMAACTLDESLDIDRLKNQHVFHDLYQVMGCWHSEPGLRVISIGFFLDEESLKERIKVRGFKDCSRKAEVNFLLHKDGGINFTQMFNTLMSYTVNMDREFGGIYTLLKEHGKFPNIVWYKINAQRSWCGVFDDILSILRNETKNRSAYGLLLSEPPMFTQRDTCHQNTQRPANNLVEPDLMKFYSKDH